MPKTLTECNDDLREIIKELKVKLYYLTGECYYNGMEVMEELDNDIAEESYCNGWIDGWNEHAEIINNPTDIAYITPWHDGNFYCSNCDQLVHLCYDFCPSCGFPLDLRDVL